ncbi:MULTISPECIES: hypothetical protein [unclassified Sphingomonas]|uniref:hypothetical protein n=1 Tax=unclassified Sphingomonas TaxID=196159 RepID=UPI00226A063A|nr:MULTISPECIES: hypothetical protein [unclassified Sphingomonas]
MTEFVPISATRTRGPRTGVIIALVALAFIAGLALMGVMMKRLPWLGGTPGTAHVSAATAAADRDKAAAGYSPAQPLNANGETPVTDTATLVTREAALAAQLAALEARTATVTATATVAGNQATRAEGMLVAFAARRALDRGLGLGYLEEQLRTRFGTSQPRAVTTVIQAARQPVTLEDLRQGLDAIAPDLNTISSDGWFTAIRRQLGNLVVLRKAGTPSTLPADRMARAKRLLEGGQVEAARAEIARLPGARDAGNWMEAANRYVTARAALDQIENAAILGQGNQPAPPPAAAPAPADPGITTDSGSDETPGIAPGV